jgi:hypothetical protein
MSSTVTTFRVQLQEHLKLQLEVLFVGGPQVSAQENRDLGCVWLESKIPMGTDGNMEQLTYGVRLFRVGRESQGATEEPRNLERLEEDVELLQAAFRAVLMEAGHDFFNVAGVAPNYDLQCVEASLTAFQRNLGARGG